jgi:integrase
VTIYRTPAGTYRYDFEFKGERYSGTGWTRREAQQLEERRRTKLRNRALGLEAPGPEDTPRFSDWAAVTLKYAKDRKKLQRPEQFETNLHMVLGFFGAKPTKRAPVTAGVYKDLRLGDVIARPELLEEFEQWMDDLGLSGARKNHYRSAVSQMYRVALLPANRRKSGVRENPMVGVPRDSVPRRLRTLTPQQLRGIIQHAAPHLQLALAIGALAPKLRLRNVLNLRWKHDVSDDLSYLIVDRHKTDKETGLPLVAPISGQLRAILRAVRRRGGTHVIQFHGKPVKDIKTALRRACREAGVKYGKGEFTYHSIRHTMATALARLRLPEPLRMRLMGHSNIATTQIYTHLAAVDESAPLEQLAAVYQFTDVMAIPRRITRGKLRGTGDPKPKKSSETRAVLSSQIRRVQARRTPVKRRPRAS